MDWILWIIPPFPIKNQKEDDDDDAADDDCDADDDDDDSLEVWSNVRVGGNMFKPSFFPIRIAILGWYPLEQTYGNQLLAVEMTRSAGRSPAEKLQLDQRQRVKQQHRCRHWSVAAEFVQKLRCLGLICVSITDHHRWSWQLIIVIIIKHRDSWWLSSYCIHHQSWTFIHHIIDDYRCISILCSSLFHHGFYHDSWSCFQ